MCVNHKTYQTDMGFCPLNERIIIKLLMLETVITIYDFRESMFLSYSQRRRRRRCHRQFQVKVFVY